MVAIRVLICSYITVQLGLFKINEQKVYTWVGRKGEIEVKVI